MKKTVSFIISAVIAAAAAVPAVTASAVNVNSPVVQNLVGDINSDGSLAISDAVLLSGYLLGSEQFTEKQYKAADLNTDGSVDTFDLVVMRQKVVADIGEDIKQTEPSYRYDTTSQIEIEGGKNAVQRFSAVITSTEDISKTLGDQFRPCIINALSSVYDDSFFEDNVLLISTQTWGREYYVPSEADVLVYNGIIYVKTRPHRVIDMNPVMNNIVIHQVALPREQYNGQTVEWYEEREKKLSFTQKYSYNQFNYGFIASYDELRQAVTGDSFSGLTEEEIDEKCLFIFNAFESKDYYDTVDTYKTQADLKEFFEDHVVYISYLGERLYGYTPLSSAAFLRKNELCIEYYDDPNTYGDVIAGRSSLSIFDKKDFEEIDRARFSCSSVRCNPDDSELILKEGPGKGGYYDNTVYAYGVSCAGKSYISINADAVQFMPHWYNHKHIADIEIAPGFEKELTENDFEITRDGEYFTISFPINKNGDMFSETYIFPDLYGTR